MSLILPKVEESRPAAPLAQIRESANEPHQPAPSIDLGAASFFLTLIDERAEAYNFRAIPLDKSRGALNLAGSLDDQDFTDRLVALNADGYGIFVVVNEGGDDDRSIRRVRAVFADFDKKNGHNLPDTWGIEPHLIIESSQGSFHAYWLVDGDGLPVEQFKGTQQRITECYSSDPSVCNPSRVMRVPGFVHQKQRDDGTLTEPFLTHIFHQSGAQSYKAERILAAFPPDTEHSTPAANTSERAIVAEGGRNQYLTSQAGQLRRRGFTEGAIRAALHAQNAEHCNPPLSVAEVDAIAHSILRYAPDPYDRPTTPEDQATIDALGRSFDKPPARKQPVKVKFVPPIDKTKPTHVVSKLIPYDEVSLLGGHGGVGKTALSAVIAAHVAEHAPPAGAHGWERDFLGHPVIGGRVLFVSLEDTAPDVREKLLSTCAAYGLNTDLVLERVEVLDYSNDDDNALAVENTRSVLTFTSAMEDVESAAQGATLVVIDNASDAFQANANDPVLVKKFMARLKKIARKNHCSVLLLVHIDKAAARHGSNNNSFTGSAQWHNASRSRLALVECDEGIQLRHEKVNKGKKAAPINIEMNDDGVPVPAVVTGATNADGELLRCLGSAITRGEIIPASRQGPGNAFSVAQTLPDYPKALHTAKQFWSAVGRLTAAGSLTRTEYLNSQRKTREKFTVAQVAQVVR